MTEPTQARLNTWIELEMVLDNLCEHKISKRNAIYRIAELMTHLPKEDKKEYLNWKEALKGENEDKRRLGYFDMKLASIMNRTGGDCLIS